MLRVSSDEDRMITDDMIQKYERKTILPNLAAYNLYITTDFTTTSEVKSDFSAMAVWAVNSNKDFFMLDLIVKRQTLTQQYEALFRLVNEWSSYGRSVEVGVEIDGQQRAHIFALEEMMRSRNEFFTFARQKGKPPTQKGILSRSSTGSKHERFRHIYPKMQNLKFYFAKEVLDSPDWREAEKQMKYTTYDGFGGHDDFMDCISQLGLIDIIYPMVQAGSYVKAPKDTTGIWRNLYVEDKNSAYDNYL
jgi:phage terminase large subunit-like protein